MFTYIVLSTVNASDPFESIKTGDTLHQGDRRILFPTQSAALHAGKQVMRRICGGAAYNQARESAEVVAVNIGGDVFGSGALPEVAEWSFDAPCPHWA